MPRRPRRGSAAVAAARARLQAEVGGGCSLEKRNAPPNAQGSAQPGCTCPHRCACLKCLQRRTISTQHLPYLPVQVASRRAALATADLRCEPGLRLWLAKQRCLWRRGELAQEQVCCLRWRGQAGACAADMRFAFLCRKSPHSSYVPEHRC